MKIDLENRLHPNGADPEILLIRAADATEAARRSCRAWEHGSDPEGTVETAAEALALAGEAVAAVRREDCSLTNEDMPETRRHRLAGAAFLLLLAGTDEHGESSDLAFRATLFRRAAAW